MTVDATTMTTAAYVRVSSRAQGYETQRAAIEQVARARGFTIERWYSEKRSGKTISRPELDRLRGDVRKGKVHRVILYRVDRLTRSGIRDTFEVIDEFRRYGCQIVTVADGFDLDGPAAEIVLAVLAWSARVERLALNERIADARERVEREGGSWGRPRRMDDYTIERAKKMRAEGRSLRQVAMALKVPRSTLQRYLAVSQKVAAEEVSETMPEARIGGGKQGAAVLCTNGPAGADHV